ncbi:response regulator transcription factor [Paenibacillus spiritus]|uniref:Response regulator transcription factor n=1 Tax=Paenibacillus spiritus TaxID=2496557 RepID=A0A5J5G6Y1_9BACL|nr:MULTISPECIES: response regulator transcription factor [Paenibacillus]KAA9002405.1 response regulator transcription factor [Paenibacillus spiritus]
MHIMLFDDHKLFAKSLEISMRGMVERFETHTSPEKMMDILAAGRPDIVLMDIHMGDYNGLEMARKVLERYPEQKIIFLSGYDLIEYHNQAIQMGTRGFINKNISIHELVEHIQFVARGGLIFPKYDSDTQPLTNREKEVLQLMAEGLRQQEVADRLYISRRTVNNHLQTINEKFNVNSTVAAIMRGIEMGIVKVKFVK